MSLEKEVVPLSEKRADTIELPPDLKKLGLADDLY